MSRTKGRGRSSSAKERSVRARVKDPGVRTRSEPELRQVGTDELSIGAGTEFNPYRRNYFALSVSDLLAAREAYHVHLTRMPLVSATAIGRYLIRRSDEDGASAYDPEEARRRHRNKGNPRTLLNSQVQEWSWPCVLVFVKRWLTPEELRTHPEAVVPPFLYLPDGRVVPVCVVEAPPTESPPPRPPHLRFPENLVGGGYPLITAAQGRDRIASLGCLVTDGQATYVLTSHHAAGEPGTEVYTFRSGRRERIGAAAPLFAGRRPFGEIYPGFDSGRTLVNLDAGLVKVDELEDWTAQVYGIGALGSMIDVIPTSLSLDWIGQNLRAFGCATGPMDGQVLAYFYRYKTVGGTDYVADLLIGARNSGPGLETRPGDSGTVWFHDGETQPAGEGRPRLRPIAVQWGGSDLSAGADGTVSFALATYLSTICRALDVELVTDHNVGYAPFWGAVGHYSIALKAPGLVKDAKLRGFLERNLDRLTYTAEDIQRDVAHRNPDPTDFVGLADVPDVVWKARITGLPRPKDKPNHYANLDLEGVGAFRGKTLRSLCGPARGPLKVDITSWNAFYAAWRRENSTVRAGALPFRVWQLFDAMVAFLKDGKPVEFLCAAGILAHYVGDASQPLHGSQFSDGRTEEEAGVHSAYESRLLNRKALDLNAALDARLGQARPAVKPVRSGHEAAVRTLELMDFAAATLPAERIFAAYRRDRSAAGFWDAVGGATIECMVRGSDVLAGVWDGAWKAGGGASLSAMNLAAVPRGRLRRLYEDKGFLPSLSLEELEDTGEFAAP